MWWIGLGAVILLVVGAASCVRHSGGTWMFNEAELPAGWPEATPVGEIQVKEYPTYRAATVREDEVDGRGQSPMFRELFQHIKRNDIPMTAPVEIGYDADAGPDRDRVSMAFLYRNVEEGDIGQDGAVAVRDLESQTMASIGVRGRYNDEQFKKQIVKLEAWLAEHADEWVASGPPRLLGYNSPFVPPFLRYGEVQVPVRPANGQDGSTSAN